MLGCALARAPRALTAAWLPLQGDSWTIAFHDAEDAVAFSLQVREVQLPHASRAAAAPKRLAALACAAHAWDAGKAGHAHAVGSAACGLPGRLCDV